MCTEITQRRIYKRIYTFFLVDLGSVRGFMDKGFSLEKVPAYVHTHTHTHSVSSEHICLFTWTAIEF
jgi:hypothetical protein